MLGSSLIAPVLPLYGQTFGVGVAVVGLLISSFGAARIFVDVPGGRLVDRLGTRRTMLIGCFIVGGAAVGAALASSFHWLVVARALQGAGSALYMIAGYSFVGRVSPPEVRGRMMSYYQGSLLIGQSLGPTVGGFTAEHFGLASPFWAYALLVAAAALLTVTAVPPAEVEQALLARGEDKEAALCPQASAAPDADPQAMAASSAHPAAHAAHGAGPKANKAPGGHPTAKAAHGAHPNSRAAHGGSPGSGGSSGSHSHPHGLALEDEGLESLLRRPDFLLVCLVAFAIAYTRMGVRGTVIPLVGNHHLGLSEGEIGFALTVAALLNLALLVPAGRMVDVYGRKVAIVPGLLESAAALTLFAISRSYPQYVLAAAVLGLGTGVAGPAPAAYVSDILPARAFGASLGVYRTFMDVGMVAGPVIAGAVADRLGLAWALVVNAALLATCGLLFAWRAPETRVPAHRTVPAVRGRA